MIYIDYYLRTTKTIIRSKAPRNTPNATPMATVIKIPEKEKIALLIYNCFNIKIKAILSVVY